MVVDTPFKLRVFIRATLAVGIMSIFAIMSGISSDVDVYGNNFYKAYFTHYISNNTLIDFRLAQSQHRIEWETSHKLPHFYLHIPKTGGYTAFGWLIRTLFSSPQMLQLPQEKQFRVCQLGVASLNHRQKSYKNTNCTMWMSKQRYNPEAANTHTLSVIQDNMSSVNTFIAQNPQTIVRKPIVERN